MVGKLLACITSGLDLQHRREEEKEEEEEEGQIISGFRSYLSDLGDSIEVSISGD